MFGSTDGEPIQAEPVHPISISSGTPLKSSKRRFRQPKTALQLAAQASFVGTQLLNGEIDLEVARAYSTTARTAAQAFGIEVTTGRFLKKTPMLELDVDGVLEDSE